MSGPKERKRLTRPVQILLGSRIPKSWRLQYQEPPSHISSLSSVVPKSNYLVNSEGTGSRDGFRVGSGVRRGDRGRAGGVGDARHIQWGERIERGGMEWREC